MVNQKLPDQTELSQLLEMAIRAATAAAEIILRYFREPGVEIQHKNDGSPVTIADQEAEQIIRKVLLTQSPEWPFDMLGEEQGLEGEGTRLRWTIDPIDGTRSFVQGVPLFGTIVALEDTVDHQALIGVIHLPVFNATYSAARGLGSWCNGRRIRTSSVTQLDQGLIAVGDPLQFSNANWDIAFHRLYELCPCLRGYTDCFGHTLVASGAVTAMVDPDLNPWDVLATQVLIEEAGGMILLRPSAVEHKVDALFGNRNVVEFLAKELKF